MTDIKYNKLKDLKSFSATDLTYRGTASQSKASPTTSTSKNFFNTIDKEKSIKKTLIQKKRLQKLSNAHPIIDTDEFRLLCKLYLPKRNQLQPNNEQTLKLLSIHLPQIIPHSNETTNLSYPKLNLEVHLFLASIMTNYVTSWYLTKLNTDDMNFIQCVYTILSDFTTDLAHRTGLALSKDNILTTIDELAAVVNTHLLTVVGTDHYCKIVEDYRKRENTTNVITGFKEDVELLESFLRTEHIIFESHEKQQQYFRILVKNILEVTFASRDGEGPLNSTIAFNFVVTIVADLVLDKVFGKLTEPDFLLSNIQRVVTSIDQKLDERTKIKTERVTIRQRIKSLISLSYKDFSYLVVWSSNSVEPQLNILDNSVLKLLDTITGFSARRPLVSSCASFANKVLSGTGFLDKINRICRKTIFKGLFQSQLLSDEALSTAISNLRHTVFNDDNQDAETTAAKPVTVESLTNDIYKLVTRNDLPVSIIELLRYREETPEDIKGNISRVLSVLDCQDGRPLLNRLLMINVIDDFATKLYGELMIAE